MNASSPSTFASYRRLAVERPVKARRYRESIQDTLARGVHPVEAARLREALQGIAAGLAVHGPTCSECGRDLTSEESVAAGVGPECQRKLSVAS